MRCELGSRMRHANSDADAVPFASARLLRALPVPNTDKLPGKSAVQLDCTLSKAMFPSARWWSRSPGPSEQPAARCVGRAEDRMSSTDFLGLRSIRDVRRAGRAASRQR